VKKKIPWLSKEERKSMEVLRNDLERQLARSRKPDRCRELERQILTLSRELEY
jgi:hypothetical protein